MEGNLTGNFAVPLRTPEETHSMPILTSNIHNIPPATIHIGPRQRKQEPNLDGLRNSIKLFGILNPILVSGTQGPPTLIAGRNRLTCALELNLETVPVLFYESLDPLELKFIELEENIKREGLHWRDHANAIGEIDKLKCESDPQWNQTKTAEMLGYSPARITQFLAVYRALNSPAIADATTLDHAYGILQRLSERRTAAIVESMLRAPLATPLATPAAPLVTNFVQQTETASQIQNQIFIHDPVIDYAGTAEQNPIITYFPSPEPPAPSILTTDFCTWAPTYIGRKFNLIHCDFPYGVDAADATIEHYENTKKLFWDLTAALTSNIDKILSYSAHLMFWLSFEYYEEVKRKLSAAGLHVINRPLIWVKSDSRGAAPGIKGTQPRHSYEICLLCFRGNRPLTKQNADSYIAPTVPNPIHATQKPEPMLEYFLSMLVDSVTDFLDPTCGSGSALLAAETLGARTTLGLEINPDYATAANAAITKARRLRAANKIVTAKQPQPEPV